MIEYSEEDLQIIKRYYAIIIATLEGAADAQDKGVSIKDVITHIKLLCNDPKGEA